MKFYCAEIYEVLQATGSDRNGLKSVEALRRLEENGKNKLQESKKDSIVKRFLMQMADPMIIILIAAAIISAITSVYADESFADVIIIMAVVIINAVLGVYQESKAEKAIEALAEMAAATSRVLRDGKVTVIKSEDLVVGDIILLEAGDAVPADGRIIESASLEIEEAALTGESVAVNKFIDKLDLGDSGDIPLGDRSNMVYMGSTVVHGRGAAVITSTGMDTQMGKIAQALNMAERSQTPLQKKLSQLSKTLTILVIAICVFYIRYRHPEKRQHRRSSAARHLHGCGQPGGRRNTRRPGGGCHHRFIHRRNEYEQEKRHYPKAYRSRNPWLRPDHMQR